MAASAGRRRSRGKGSKNKSDHRSAAGWRSERCAGMVGRGFDNHETCGPLHSNLRLVNLAMLREDGCPQLGAGRPREEAALVLPASSSLSLEPPFAPGLRGLLMRRVQIVEKPNETYSYAALDQQTGEVLLRLSDRHALAALCQRLGWAVEEKSSARETRPRQRTRERHRTHQGRARPRVGGATKLISPRKRQERSHLGD
jgi:hypothetical protein